MALIPLISVALCIAALYRYILYPLFLSPVARIPAVHPIAKLSALYMLWIRYTDKENATVFAAHEKYGEVVQLGPRELSVNCVDNGIKVIYGMNFDRHYFYNVYEDCGRQNLSSSLDARSHGIRKKRITHIYSKSHLHHSPAVMGLIDQIIRHRFLSLVSGFAKNQQSSNTMPLLSALALDLVTGYTFGVGNGTNFLNDKEEHEWCIGEIHNGRPYETLFWLHEFPGVVSFLERIGLDSKHRYHSLEALHAFCLKMCDRTENALVDSKAEAVSRPEEDPTVYRQFKRSLDKEGVSAIRSVEVFWEGILQNPISCSPQMFEIAAEVGDQIHASDETLSITLTYAIWELSRDRDMQRRLRHECQSLGSEVYADSAAALPAVSMVDRLPLLHAVIMETLRVHPVVAGGQARVTPYGKLSRLGNYEDIPGGYRVQSYARFLHHNSDVFPDPLQWHPERWLQTVGEKEPDQKLRWFWAFSSGARMCLGSHFAQLVMKYVLVLVYSNFKTNIVDDEGIEHMEGYVGGPKSGKLLVKASPIAPYERQGQ